MRIAAIAAATGSVFIAVGDLAERTGRDTALR